MPRKILIGTPTMMGRPDYRYSMALFEVKAACPDWEVHLAFGRDSLLIRSRSETVKFALKNEYDELVFIDDDMGWTVEQFKRILSHNEPFVGGLYLKKQEEPHWVALFLGNLTDERGLLPVAGIGCGFMRLRRDAMKKLYHHSPLFNGGRLMFESAIDTSGELTTEDFMLCQKWRKLGGTVWADTQCCVDHCDGSKVYSGVFSPAATPGNPHS